ncbi:Cytochrome c553-like protein [Denitrovibrio acetiphilus DSM 12809]|uniref:Cytochrome c553-like protein n=1 Tax=Denitrovibrio acetiphilus (strain DSM 12809 / NBRC 114555 / N2460) TaxID=522772 RepID=D4H8U7_DENA2|nr:c-type cytochrome [Denitrovibrio acetiphilus]ADD68446.1 Cytochrome c553-like protein [Denitrovibrio acetiphilus DSM 12809]
MKKSKWLFNFVITAMVLILPVAGFSEANVSEGARLGKTCAGCHGTSGNTPGKYIATIGGQNPDYMAKVLKEFSGGEREGSVEMSIIAKGYSDEQLESIALYYSSQGWVNSTNNTDSAKSKMGRQVAAENGCMDCHGARGEGLDEYPHIGGQNLGYLKEVLKRYRSGAIKSEEMGMVADLDDEQINALANYLSGLRQGE